MLWWCTDDGVTRAFPTVLVTLFEGAGRPLPSVSTIARVPRPQPPLMAIGAIASGRTDDTRTQHWPWHGARTSAPGHTRTTALPGRQTSWHWTHVPVSDPTNEDENGDATSTVPTAHAWCV